MGAYVKSVLRMFRNNLGRIFAITAISALGVAFIAGVGAVAPNIRAAADDYFFKSAVPDIIVKSTAPTGFTQSMIDTLVSNEEVEAHLSHTVIDTEISGRMTRLYYYPLGGEAINKLEIAEGRLPEAAGEILVERESHFIEKAAVGDEIEYLMQRFKVVGIAANPLLMSREAEPSIPDEEDIKSVIYIDSTLNTFPLPVTDVYIRLSGTSGLSYFSKDYKKAVAGNIDALKAAAGADAENLVFLTLEENLSFVLLEVNADRIENLSYIFPVFFIAVAALVVLTTMTRLVEKERPLAGCLKTLGFGNSKISSKYILFAVLCCLLGSGLGLIAGDLIIVPVIYKAYGTLFHLAPLVSGFHLLFGIIAALIMTLAVAAVTMYVAGKLLREKPAELLRHKAPKPGKKILLERIGFIWKRLKFKYKSTLRNIFRHTKHFVMTVVSVAGATALVFAGFALYDAASANSYTASVAGRASESLSVISLVIIICAALLNILVIYNLTNINIEERKREIATLKVLGYKDGEVTGYIFREVLILALIGILVGLPLGYLFIHFVFGYIEFGSVSDINWYSWLFTFVLSVSFTLVVDLMLFRKITKTDMNASLKTVE